MVIPSALKEVQNTKIIDFSTGESSDIIVAGTGGEGTIDLTNWLARQGIPVKKTTYEQGGRLVIKVPHGMIRQDGITQGAAYYPETERYEKEGKTFIEPQKTKLISSRQGEDGSTIEEWRQTTGAFAGTRFERTIPEATMRPTETATITAGKAFRPEIQKEGAERYMKEKVEFGQRPVSMSAEEAFRRGFISKEEARKGGEYMIDEKDMREADNMKKEYIRILETTTGKLSEEEKKAILDPNRVISENRKTESISKNEEIAKNINAFNKAKLGEYYAKERQIERNYDTAGTRAAWVMESLGLEPIMEFGKWGVMYASGATKTPWNEQVKRILKERYRHILENRKILDLKTGEWVNIDEMKKDRAYMDIEGGATAGATGGFMAATAGMGGPILQGSAELIFGGMVGVQAVKTVGDPSAENLAETVVLAAPLAIAAAARGAGTLKGKLTEKGAKIETATKTAEAAENKAPRYEDMYHLGDTPATPAEVKAIEARYESIRQNINRWTKSNRGRELIKDANKYLGEDARQVAAEYMAQGNFETAEAMVRAAAEKRRATPDNMMKAFEEAAKQKAKAEWLKKESIESLQKELKEMTSDFSKEEMDKITDFIAKDDYTGAISEAIKLKNAREAALKEKLLKEAEEYMRAEKRKDAEKNIGLELKEAMKGLNEQEKEAVMAHVLKGDHITAVSEAVKLRNAKETTLERRLIKEAEEFSKSRNEALSELASQSYAKLEQKKAYRSPEVKEAIEVSKKVMSPEQKLEFADMMARGEYRKAVNVAEKAKENWLRREAISHTKTVAKEREKAITAAKEEISRRAYKEGRTYDEYMDRLREMEEWVKKETAREKNRLRSLEFEQARVLEKGKNKAEKLFEKWKKKDKETMEKLRKGEIKEIRTKDGKVMLQEVKQTAKETAKKVGELERKIKAEEKAIMRRGTLLRESFLEELAALAKGVKDRRTKTRILGMLKQEYKKATDTRRLTLQMVKTKDATLLERIIVQELVLKRPTIQASVVETATKEASKITEALKEKEDLISKTGGDKGKSKTGFIPGKKSWKGKKKAESQRGRDVSKVIVQDPLKAWEGTEKYSRGVNLMKMRRQGAFYA